MYSFYAFQGLKNRIFTTFTRVLNKHLISYVSSSSPSHTTPLSSSQFTLPLGVVQNVTLPFKPPLHHHFEHERKMCRKPQPSVETMWYNERKKHMQIDHGSLHVDDLISSVLMDIHSSSPLLKTCVQKPSSSSSSLNKLVLKNPFLPIFLIPSTLSTVPTPPSSPVPVRKKEDSDFPTFSLCSNPRFIFR